MRYSDKEDAEAALQEALEIRKERLRELRESKALEAILKIELDNIKTLTRIIEEGRKAATDSLREEFFRNRIQ